MNRPIVTRGNGGEYSTTVLPNGIVETIWFGDDGSHRNVSRSHPETADSIHHRHIAEDTQ